MKAFLLLERPLFSNDTLYKQEYNYNPKSNLCFVFCHFDMDGELNESVKHYLKSIAAIGDIIFVSNAPLLSSNESALEFLNKICMNVYVRNNDSYDFGCWAYGITNNLPQIRLHYQALICCNDSCFGPLCNLTPIIDDFILGEVDVGGLPIKIEDFIFRVTLFFIIKILLLVFSNILGKYKELA